MKWKVFDQKSWSTLLSSLDRINKTADASASAVSGLENDFVALTELTKREVAGKQDALKGAAGQVVCFDKDGRAVALDVAALGVSADAVSFSPGSAAMSSRNVQDAIQEVFTSGSNGKALVASAVTAKGVSTAPDATFSEIRDNILATPVGGSTPDGLRTISVRSNLPEAGLVSGGGFASDGMMLTIKADPLTGYKFNGWQENGEMLSDDAEYAFMVAEDREICAMFEENPNVTWAETVVPFEDVIWDDVIYGDDKFVAIGHGIRDGYVGRIAYSRDGITWVEAALPSSFMDGYSAARYGIIYGDGKFVAMASAYDSTISGYVASGAYSTDGINWTEIAIPFKNSGYATYCGGKFMVADSRGSATDLFVSTDGITWVDVTIPSFTGCYSIIYCDGKFIMMGSDGNIVYSTDCINWTNTKMPGGFNWRYPAYGNGRFVTSYSAYGRGYVAYSTDGINWTETVPSFPSSLSDVIYGNGKFVVVGKGKAFVSTDGINWTETVMPVDRNYWIAFCGDGKFVTVSYDYDSTTSMYVASCAYSTDGINWTETIFPSFYGGLKFVYGNKRFISFPLKTVDRNIVFYTL